MKSLISIYLISVTLFSFVSLMPKTYLIETEDNVDVKEVIVKLRQRGN